MIWNLFSRRPDGRAIPMPDHALTPSDAGRIMAEQSRAVRMSRHERERAMIRANCRKMLMKNKKPIPAILEN